MTDYRCAHPTIVAEVFPCVVLGDLGLPVKGPVTNADGWALDVMVEEPGMYLVRLHVRGPLPLLAAVRHDGVQLSSGAQWDADGGTDGVYVQAYVEVDDGGATLRCELSAGSTLMAFEVISVHGDSLVPKDQA